MIRPTVILLSMSLLGAMKMPLGCSGESRHEKKAAAVGKAARTNAPPAGVSAPAPKPSPPPAAVPETGPEVRITSPLKNEVVESADVGVFLKVKDLPADSSAHVHVILDNQPPEDVTDFLLPVVLRQVRPGLHVLRAFACDANHVSFKNPAAFAMTWFAVGDSRVPAVAFDPELPTLTFNLPGVAYRKVSTKNLPVDFLVNGPIEPGQWRVRVMVDAEPKGVLDRVDPAFTINLGPGDRAVRLELLDGEGRLMKANFAWSERTVQVR
ncbi:MAG: hypothetical protein HZA91_02120 [Verrucomicrobia bacterium]|nr:hypothetical protein [Verrucomicrobiota bacterium]